MKAPCARAAKCKTCEEMRCLSFSHQAGWEAAGKNSLDHSVLNPCQPLKGLCFSSEGSSGLGQLTGPEAPASWLTRYMTLGQTLPLCAYHTC